MRIDTLAYGSQIYGVSPFPKVLGVLCCLALTFFFSSPLVSGCGLVISSVITIFFGAITLCQYLKLFLLPLCFLFMTTVTIVIAPCLPQEALWGGFLFQQFYGITQASLQFGENLWIKALACIGWFYCLMLHTPMPQIMTVLRRWKIPEVVLLLMSFMYRYIFLLLDEMQKMQIAQQARLGDGKALKKLKNSFYLFSTLFLRTYYRCDQVDHALSARGYVGVDTYQKTFNVQNNNQEAKAYGVVIAVSVLLLGIGIGERFLR